MLKSPTFLFSQSPLHISTRNLLPQIESAGGGDNRSVVNPVRNPSGALNPAGIILKPRCRAAGFYF